MRREKLILRGEDGREEIQLERQGSVCTVSRAGRQERVETAKLADGRLSLLFEDGRQFCGRVVSRGNRVKVTTARGATRILLADPLRDRLARSGGAGQPQEQEEEIRALMPGRVVEVCVAPGEQVVEGGLLLVLEAMKMQNEIRAPFGGSVVRVEVSPGQAVEGGSFLLAVRP